MKTSHPIPILPALCAGLALLGSSAIQADIVHNDDVIIDGSLAVGFDAVNGESFGFDTIRLKENNLRIRFDDTSIAASFPRNDWQIIANDSANGGSSYLGIEDNSAGRLVFRVFAGARSNSLVVDSQGDVGIGTATPSVTLHTVEGDTPTLRLEQNASSGFAPQTWDVAGNETNFFIRDVTHGSKLPFRVRPDAATSSLFIDADSNIGNLTSSPDASIHVLRAGAGDTAQIHVEDSGGAGAETLLSLENNGPCRISQSDTAGGTTWLTNVTDAAGTGEWRLSESSTGDVEFAVTETGNVRITGDFITDANTYPDFVFKDSYDLMPLAELREYIEAERHLPEIPKEAEVKESGLKLAELQLKLLQKVEELTLYTLQQEKRIGDLTERLTSMEKENQQLRGASQ